MNNTDQKLIERQENEALKQLKQCMKEQFRLFYSISGLNEKKLSIEELLNKTVDLISESRQDTDAVAACIEYNGKMYHTANYKETNRGMSAEAVVRKESLLVVKITSLENSPDFDTDLIREEKQHLLDSVAIHLALKMDKILSQKELEENQQTLDKAYKLARIGTWEYNMLTHELYWSPLTKEVHGFGHDYQPDVESTIKLFKEGFNREVFAKAAYDAIEHEKPFDVELKIISGQGDERWIRATGEPEYKDGICTRFYGISQNVTDRKKAEEDLQLNEQRFKALVQDGSDLIAILDEMANYKYVSPTSETVLGIPATEFIGNNALDFIHKDDKERVIEHLSRLSTEKRICVEPFRFIDAHDNWRWVETTITNMKADPAVGGLVANSRDVTEKKLQQEQILESLKEKETLLAEIHHRVKNNLAVVTGLLQLQAAQENNSEVTDRLNDSIARVETMANIHEQLYQSNSFSKLEFTDNIRRLISSILQTFRTETDVNIDFDCEPLQLNIKQAMPSSLIVNEIITNILKHAFPGREKGKIAVRLSESENNQITLSIRDNGIGLPENFNIDESSSLGLSLIEVLAQQLKADFSFDSTDEGTTFTLRFKKAGVKAAPLS